VTRQYPARFRLATPVDDPSIAAIIASVMPQFGASGAGFASNDPEVEHMSAAYDAPRSAYFVVERDAQVLGGAGIAPLAGGPFHTCELRKMYFLSAARGAGLGALLLLHCLRVARGFGFRRCYLETLTGMDAAMRLYERAGFRRISAALGSTGHFGCDRYYVLDL
jgi:putative acetyltransferase